MPESNGFCSSSPRETVCIDTQRVLDSCRDRDCYENTRVFLTDYGEELIGRTTNVRVRDCEIADCTVCLEPVDFSRGFYRVNCRYYIRLRCEACLGRGTSESFEGLCVCDKNVVLFGSEGNVHIFRSGDSCCDADAPEQTDNAPSAVCEAVDPVVLGCRVCDPNTPCGSVCEVSEIPERVCRLIDGAFSCCRDRRVLQCSVGIFSVIRLERPAQYLISASSYAVPDKECTPAEDEIDPCGLFRTMDFPTSEFAPPNANCINR